MIKMKYKGRTFSNGRSLANAITRDMNHQIEQSVRKAAGASGVRVRKTQKGFEVNGDTEQINRFYKRFGK